MASLHFYVLLLINHFTKAYAAIGARNEELMTTTTQPSNGLLNDSMSDFNLPNEEEEDAETSLQRIIEWFGFALIMVLLVLLIVLGCVALFVKIRSFVKKKINK